MDRDDVVFQLPDGSFAVSHLTWAMERERAGPYPLTELYLSTEALQALLNESHSEYAP